MGLAVLAVWTGGCGPRASSDGEATPREASAPAKDGADAGDASPGRDPKPRTRRQRGFSVVSGKATPYLDAGGTPLPWPHYESDHDLGGREPGYVVRRLDDKGGRVRVETVSSRATPSDGCGVGIDGLDPFALQFWVDDSALLEVVTERTRSSYPDSTTVELLAGTPVREMEPGVWVADAWGVTLDLANEPPKRGKTFAGLDHLTGTAKGRLEGDAKLRVGDALVPTFMLRSDQEGIMHFGADRGLYWVQLPCAQLLAAPNATVETTMPVSLGLSGGGRGGTNHPDLGMHVLEKGAPVSWANGEPAGRARRRHVMAGERFAGTTPDRRCYEQRFANGARAVLLCPDPGRSREVAWIEIGVGSVHGDSQPKAKQGPSGGIDPKIRARAVLPQIRACAALGLANGHALAEEAKLDLRLRRVAAGEPFNVARMDGSVFADGPTDRETKRCVREAIDALEWRAPGFVQASYTLTTAK